MATDKPYASKSAEFHATHTPVTSLDDPRIEAIMAREYEVETDTSYEDTTYQQALAMAEGDAEKAGKIYQEFQRARDAMHVIDHQNTDIELAGELIRSFIKEENFRIEAIVHQGDPGLPPEE